MELNLDNVATVLKDNFGVENFFALTFKKEGDAVELCVASQATPQQIVHGLENFFESHPEVLLELMLVRMKKQAKMEAKMEAEEKFNAPTNADVAAG